MPQLAKLFYVSFKPVKGTTSLLRAKFLLLRKFVLQQKLCEDQCLFFFNKSNLCELYNLYDDIHKQDTVEKDLELI